MLDVIGKTCPYCKSQIASILDVVTCSACQMPHHKECWVENQGCTTFGCSGSISGEDLVNQKVECPSCHAMNASDSRFCGSCGTSLQQSRGQVQEQERVSPYDYLFSARNEEFVFQSQAIIKDEGFRVFVGTNHDYFARVFSEFDRNPAATNWNWASFFFPYTWYFYRKMYQKAAIILAVLLVASLINRPLFFMVLIGMCIYTGLQGNKDYYMHYKKNRAQYDALPDFVRQHILKQNGGTNLAAAILIPFAAKLGSYLIIAILVGGY